MKKLRVQLVAAAMLSLFLVLTVIVGGLHLINYRQIVRDADAVLNILAENGGVFPKIVPHKGEGGGRVFSPELPYESRFFSVFFSESGQVVMVDTGRIAAVDTAAAIAYARGVYDGGRARGFQDDYRFLLQSTESGARAIFLDCGRGLSAFRTSLLGSAGVSLAGLLCVLGLLLLFSGRIIRPVAESYEKQKRFITDAGHEIKTPLSIISADAEVLALDVGENEWLSDIRKQTGRLSELTASLIALSRMEETAQALPRIDFPLSDVVSEAAQSFQAPAKLQSKQFSLHIQPLLTLRGDEKAIRQLTGILLDNALKYSPEGGAVSLSLEKQGRCARLCVFNTAAVSPEALPRLFDRFYRADPSRNSSGGYGIGLSIAKAIVSAHKGRIAAASPDGRSLEITALLPLR